MIFVAKECTVGEAPCGLFHLNVGEIICISEYMEGGRRLAIIVESGEYYHGDGDAALGRPIIVQVEND